MEGIESTYQNLLVRKFLKELAVEYPEPLDGYPEEAVLKINCCHTTLYEYYLRNNVGIQTELMSYQNGCIELEVLCSQTDLSVERYRFRVWSQIEAWFANHYLLRASQFLAHLYSPVQFQPLMSKREQSVHPRLEISTGICRGRLDVKITEWRGWLGDPVVLINTPGSLRPLGIF